MAPDISSRSLRISCRVLVPRMFLSVVIIIIIIIIILIDHHHHLRVVWDSSRVEW